MISADLSFTATRLNFPSYYIKCFYQNHENNLMIGHGKTSRRRLKNALAAERRHFAKQKRHSFLPPFKSMKGEVRCGRQGFRLGIHAKTKMAPFRLLLIRMFTKL
jgi:NOL1/NOP2/fmu family ribosome biogenesis protein